LAVRWNTVTCSACWAKCGIDCVPEALVPILAVVRAQQVASSLARARGLDPDAPSGLSKVTAT